MRIPYLASSRMAVAFLKCFGLLKGQGVVKSQGRKANLVPTPSSLSASDRNVFFVLTPVPPLMLKISMAHQHNAHTSLRAIHGLLSWAAKHSSTKLWEHSLWECSLHGHTGQEPAVLAQQQEHDVFHSMCTCFPVGHCIPESQHPCVPAVSLPSRLTSVDVPVLALGAELMEARRSSDTLLQCPATLPSPDSPLLISARGSRSWALSPVTLAPTTPRITDREVQQQWQEKLLCASAVACLFV